MRTDYYSILGVPREADQASVRAAYRRLARAWHPDLNGESEAAARFARINEAYAVLGDAKRRARWEAEGGPAGAATPHTVPLKPVCCSECGRVTAQPRILVFRSSIGLGVWSRVHRNEGVFCSTCARKSGLRASTLTALAGWWALPAGPLIALWCIIGNALGGSRRPTGDRRLTLLNAQVFLDQDKPALAQALARRVLKGAAPEEAQKAQEIIQHARLRGVSDAPPLKDNWGASPSYLATHLILLFAPPAVIAVFLFAVLR